VQGRLRKIGKLHLGHKLTAIFLSISFSLFNFFEYSSTKAYAQVPYQEVTKETLKLPAELGTVEESHKGSLNKTILYIQDAHDSLEAQEHIAKLIHQFVKERGVKTVFEEGYEGRVPTDKFFGFIKDPKIKEKVSYFLLDKLRIGGAEYAHINRTEDFKLIGVDQLKLYHENVKWYQRAAKKRKVTEEDLSELLKYVTQLAHQSFPKDLKAWLKLKERFTKEKLLFLDYLRETQALFLKIIRKDEFITHYPFLTLILQAQGSKDPQIAKQLKSLESKSVFKELAQLEQDFSAKLIQNKQDETIFTFYQGLSLLKRLNQIELTQEEYEAAKETLKELKTEELLHFIVSYTHKPLVLSKTWERNIQDAIQFYEVAQERGQEIESHLKDFIQDPKEETAILVFGGFHSHEIKEILKRGGLSYYLISPKITSNDKEHQANYKHLMSNGYYSFETSFQLPQALRAESVFSRANFVGATQIHDELNAMVLVTQRLGDMGGRWDARLLDQIIEKQLTDRNSMKRTSRIVDREKSITIHKPRTTNGEIPRAEVRREAVSGGNVFGGLGRRTQARLLKGSEVLLKSPFHSSPLFWLGYIVIESEINPTIVTARIIFHVVENSPNNRVAKPAVPMNWANVIADLAIKWLLLAFISAITISQPPNLVNNSKKDSTIDINYSQYIVNLLSILQRIHLVPSRAEVRVGNLTNLMLNRRNFSHLSLAGLLGLVGIPSAVFLSYKSVHMQKKPEGLVFPSLSSQMKMFLKDPEVVSTFHAPVKSFRMAARLADLQIAWRNEEVGQLTRKIIEQYEEDTKKSLPEEVKQELKTFQSMIIDPKTDPFKLLKLYTQLEIAVGGSYGARFWLDKGYKLSFHGLRHIEFQWLVHEMQNGPIQSLLSLKLQQALDVTEAYLLGRIPWNDQVVQAFLNIKTELENKKDLIDRIRTTYENIVSQDQKRFLDLFYQRFTKEQIQETSRWFSEHHVRIAFPKNHPWYDLYLISFRAALEPLPPARYEGVILELSKEAVSGVSYDFRTDVVYFSFEHMFQGLDTPLGNFLVTKDFWTPIWVTINHELSHRWDFQQLPVRIRKSFYDLSWDTEKVWVFNKRRQLEEIRANDPFAPNADALRDFVLNFQAGKSGYAEEDIAVTVEALLEPKRAAFEVARAIHNLQEGRPHLANKIAFAYKFWERIPDPNGSWIVRLDKAEPNQFYGTYAYRTASGRTYKMTLFSNGKVTKPILINSSIDPNKFLQKSDVGQERKPRAEVRTEGLNKEIPEGAVVSQKVTLAYDLHIFPVTKIHKTMKPLIELGIRFRFEKEESPDKRQVLTDPISQTMLRKGQEILLVVTGNPDQGLLKRTAQVLVSMLNNSGFSNPSHVVKRFSTNSYLKDIAIKTEIDEIVALVRAGQDQSSRAEVRSRFFYHMFNLGVSALPVITATIAVHFVKRQVSTLFLGTLPGLFALGLIRYVQSYHSRTPLRIVLLRDLFINVAFWFASLWPVTALHIGGFITIAYIGTLLYSAFFDRKTSQSPEEMGHNLEPSSLSARLFLLGIPIISLLFKSYAVSIYQVTFNQAVKDFLSPLQSILLITSASSAWVFSMIFTRFVQKHFAWILIIAGWFGHSLEYLILNQVTDAIPMLYYKASVDDFALILGVGLILAEWADRVLKLMSSARKPARDFLDQRLSRLKKAKPWPYEYLQVNWPFRAWLPLHLFFLRWFVIRFRASGVSHIPKTGPAMLVSNHKSLLDGLFLSYEIFLGSRRVVISVVKPDEVGKGPLAKLQRWLFSLSRAPVIIYKGTDEKDPQKAEVAREKLKEELKRNIKDHLLKGKLVLIFPSGRAQRFARYVLEGWHKTFAEVIVELREEKGIEIPIIPVGISGKLPLDLRLSAGLRTKLSWGHLIKVLWNWLKGARVPLSLILRLAWKRLARWLWDGLIHIFQSVATTLWHWFLAVSGFQAPFTMDVEFGTKLDTGGKGLVQIFEESHDRVADLLDGKSINETLFRKSIGIPTGAPVLEPLISWRTSRKQVLDELRTKAPLDVVIHFGTDDAINSRFVLGHQLASYYVHVSPRKKVTILKPWHHPFWPSRLVQADIEEFEEFLRQKQEPKAFISVNLDAYRDPSDFSYRFPHEVGGFLNRFGFLKLAGSKIYLWQREGTEPIDISLREQVIALFNHQVQELSHPELSREEKSYGHLFQYPFELSGGLRQESNEVPTLTAIPSPLFLRRLIWNRFLRLRGVFAYASSRLLGDQRDKREIRRIHREVKQTIRQIAKESPLFLNWHSGHIFPELTGWTSIWMKHWEREANQDLDPVGKIRKLYLARAYSPPGTEEYERISKRIIDNYIEAREAEYHKDGRAPPEMKRVEIPSDSGSIHSYLILPPNISPAQKIPIVIFFHGLSETKGDPYFDAFEKALIQIGIAVLRVDLPRHGENKGHVLNSGNLEAYAREILSYLQNQGQIDPRRIGIFGFSFGGNLGARAFFHRELGAQIQAFVAINPPAESTFRNPRRWLPRRQIIEYIFGKGPPHTLAARIRSLALSKSNDLVISPERLERMLLLIGTKDNVVSPFDFVDFLKRKMKGKVPKDRIQYFHEGHHIYKGMPEAVEATVTHFQKFLLPESQIGISRAEVRTGQTAKPELTENNFMRYVILRGGFVTLEGLARDFKRDEATIRYYLNRKFNLEALRETNRKNVQAWIPIVIRTEKRLSRLQKILAIIERSGGQATLGEIAEGLGLRGRIKREDLFAQLDVEKFFTDVNHNRKILGKTELQVVDISARNRQRLIAALEDLNGMASSEELAERLGVDYRTAISWFESIPWREINRKRKSAGQFPLYPRLIDPRRKEVQNQILSFIEQSGGVALIHEIALHVNRNESTVSEHLKHIDWRYVNEVRRYLDLFPLRVFLKTQSGQARSTRSLGLHQNDLPRLKKGGDTEWALQEINRYYHAKMGARGFRSFRFFTLPLIYEQFLSQISQVQKEVEKQQLRSFLRRLSFLIIDSIPVPRIALKHNNHSRGGIDRAPTLNDYFQVRVPRAINLSKKALAERNLPQFEANLKRVLRDDFPLLMVTIYPAYGGRRAEVRMETEADWIPVNWNQNVVKALTQLTHPSLPSLRVSRKSPEDPTEQVEIRWIKGERMSQWAQRSEKLSDEEFERQLIAWTIQIMEAVTLLHKAGIQHGDLHPGNIVIDQSSKQPILIDFGHFNVLDLSSLTRIISDSLEWRVRALDLSDQLFPNDSQIAERIKQRFDLELIKLINKSYSSAQEFLDQMKEYSHRRWPVDDASQTSHRAEVRIAKESVDAFFVRVSEAIGKLPRDLGRYRLNYEFKTFLEVEQALAPLEDEIKRGVLEIYRNRGFMVGPEMGTAATYWIDSESSTFRFSNLLDLIKRKIIAHSGIAEEKDLEAAKNVLEETIEEKPASQTDSAKTKEGFDILDLDSLQIWLDLVAAIQAMDQTLGRAEVRNESHLDPALGIELFPGVLMLENVVIGTLEGVYPRMDSEHESFDEISPLDYFHFLEFIRKGDKALYDRIDKTAEGRQGLNQALRTSALLLSKPSTPEGVQDLQNELREYALQIAFHQFTSPSLDLNLFYDVLDRADNELGLETFGKTLGQLVNFAQHRTSLSPSELEGLSQIAAQIKIKADEFYQTMMGNFERYITKLPPESADRESPRAEVRNIRNNSGANINRSAPQSSRFDSKPPDARAEVRAGAATRSIEKGRVKQLMSRFEADLRGVQEVLDDVKEYFEFYLSGSFSELEVSDHLRSLKQDLKELTLHKQWIKRQAATDPERVSVPEQKILQVLSDIKEIQDQISEQKIQKIVKVQALAKLSQLKIILGEIGLQLQPFDQKKYLEGIEAQVLDSGRLIRFLFTTKLAKQVLYVPIGGRMVRLPMIPKQYIGKTVVLEIGSAKADENIRVIRVYENQANPSSFLYSYVETSDRGFIYSHELRNVGDHYTFTHPLFPSQTFYINTSRGFNRNLSQNRFRLILNSDDSIREILDSHGHKRSFYSILDDYNGKQIGTIILRSDALALRWPSLRGVISKVPLFLEKSSRGEEYGAAYLTMNDRVRGTERKFYLAPKEYAGRTVSIRVEGVWPVEARISGKKFYLILKRDERGQIVDVARENFMDRVGNFTGTITRFKSNRRGSASLGAPLTGIQIADESDHEVWMSAAIVNGVVIRTDEWGSVPPANVYKFSKKQDGPLTVRLIKQPRRPAIFHRFVVLRDFNQIPLDSYKLRISSEVYKKHEGIITGLTIKRHGKDGRLTLPDHDYALPGYYSRFPALALRFPKANLILFAILTKDGKKVQDTYFYELGGKTLNLSFVEQAELEKNLRRGYRYTFNFDSVWREKIKGQKFFHWGRKAYLRGDLDRAERNFKKVSKRSRPYYKRAQKYLNKGIPRRRFILEHGTERERKRLLYQFDKVQQQSSRAEVRSGFINKFDEMERVYEELFKIVKNEFPELILDLPDTGQFYPTSSAIIPKLFSFLKDKINGNQDFRILDFGSGDSRMAYRLALMGDQVRVTAAELNPFFAVLARIIKDGVNDRSAADLFKVYRSLRFSKKSDDELHSKIKMLLAAVRRLRPILKHQKILGNVMPVSGDAFRMPETNLKNYRAVFLNVPMVDELKIKKFWSQFLQKVKDELPKDSYLILVHHSFMDDFKLFEMLDKESADFKRISPEILDRDFVIYQRAAQPASRAEVRTWNPPPEYRKQMVPPGVFPQVFLSEPKKGEYERQPLESKIDRLNDIENKKMYNRVKRASRMVASSIRYLEKRIASHPDEGTRANLTKELELLKNWIRVIGVDLPTLFFYTSEEDKEDKIEIGQAIQISYRRKSITFPIKFLEKFNPVNQRDQAEVAFYLLIAANLIGYYYQMLGEIHEKEMSHGTYPVIFPEIYKEVDRKLKDRQFIGDIFSLLGIDLTSFIQRMKNLKGEDRKLRERIAKGFVELEVSAKQKVKAVDKALEDWGDDLGWEEMDKQVGRKIRAVATARGLKNNLEDVKEDIEKVINDLEKAAFYEEITGHRKKVPKIYESILKLLKHLQKVDPQGYYSIRVQWKILYFLLRLGDIERFDQEFDRLLAAEYVPPVFRSLQLDLQGVMKLHGRSKEETDRFVLRPKYLSDWLEDALPDMLLKLQWYASFVSDLAELKKVEQVEKKLTERLTEIRQLAQTLERFKRDLTPYREEKLKKPFLVPAVAVHPPEIFGFTWKVWNGKGSKKIHARVEVFQYLAAGLGNEPVGYFNFSIGRNPEGDLYAFADSESYWAKSSSAKDPLFIKPEIHKRFIGIESALVILAINLAAASGVKMYFDLSQLKQPLYWVEGSRKTEVKVIEDISRESFINAPILIRPRVSAFPETLDIEGALTRFLSPRIELNDNEKRIYFKGKAPQNKRFYLRKLHPKQDIHFIDEWRKSIERDAEWQRLRETMGGGYFEELPHYHSLIGLDIGLISKDETGREKLEGYVGLRPFMTGASQGIPVYQFAVQQFELYYRNIGRNAEVEGIADLLLDFVTKFIASAADFKGDGITLNPEGTPGGIALARRRRMEELPSGYWLLTQQKVEELAPSLANRFLGRRAEVRAANMDLQRSLLFEPEEYVRYRKVREFLKMGAAKLAQQREIPVTVTQVRSYEHPIKIKRERPSFKYVEVIAKHAGVDPASIDRRIMTQRLLEMDGLENRLQWLKALLGEEVKTLIPDNPSSRDIENLAVKIHIDPAHIDRSFLIQRLQQEESLKVRLQIVRKFLGLTSKDMERRFAKEFPEGILSDSQIRFYETKVTTKEKSDFLPLGQLARYVHILSQLAQITPDYILWGKSLKATLLETTDFVLRLRSAREFLGETRKSLAEKGWIPEGYRNHKLIYLFEHQSVTQRVHPPSSYVEGLAKAGGIDPALIDRDFLRRALLSERDYSKRLALIKGFVKGVFDFGTNGFISQQEVKDISRRIGIDPALVDRDVLVERLHTEKKLPMKLRKLRAFLDETRPSLAAKLDAGAGQIEKYEREPYVGPAPRRPGVITYHQYVRELTDLAGVNPELLFTEEVKKYLAWIDSKLNNFESFLRDKDLIQPYSFYLVHQIRRSFHHPDFEDIRKYAAKIGTMKKKPNLEENTALHDLRDLWDASKADPILKVKLLETLKGLEDEFKEALKLQSAFDSSDSLTEYLMGQVKQIVALKKETFSLENKENLRQQEMNERIFQHQLELRRLMEDFVVTKQTKQVQEILGRVNQFDSVSQPEMEILTLKIYEDIQQLQFRSRAEVRMENRETRGERTKEEIVSFLIPHPSSLLDSRRAEVRDDSLNIELKSQEQQGSLNRKNLGSQATIHELQTASNEPRTSRSELRFVPAQGAVSSSRTDQMVRELRHNAQPANVFVNAEDFQHLSLDQKNEYLYAALTSKGLRIIVYNEKGQVHDQELDQLLKLDHIHVRRTHQDLNQALLDFTRPNTPNIHLSKTILPSKELIQNLKNKVAFFKQKGNKSGTLAVALLWAFSNAQELTSSWGVHQGKDGLWTVSENLIASIQESYDRNLAFAWAA